MESMIALSINLTWAAINFFNARQNMRNVQHLRVLSVLAQEQYGAALQAMLVRNVRERDGALLNPAGLVYDVQELLRKCRRP